MKEEKRFDDYTNVLMFNKIDDDIDKSSLDDINMYILCKEFGWTCDEYKNTQYDDIEKMLLIHQIWTKKQNDLNSK